MPVVDELENHMDRVLKFLGDGGRGSRWTKRERLRKSHYLDFNFFKKFNILNIKYY
jgi:hypothetical protein